MPRHPLRDALPAVAVLIVAPVSGQSYTLTALDTLPGPGPGASIAWGMNQDGDVAGESTSFDANLLSEAFHWSGGVMTGCGSIQAFPFHTIGTDVNDADIVVGHSVTPLGWQAFRWDDTNGMTGLGYWDGCPGGEGLDFSSRANAINTAGVIVGRTSTATRCAEAYLWSGGNFQQLLGVLSGADDSEAHDVNDAALMQICGWSGFEAFLWDANTGMVALAALTSYDECAAWALNDDGDVVGYSRDSNTTDQQATFWRAVSSHVPVGLGQLGVGLRSRATDINAHDVVVGISEFPTNGWHAIVWDDCNGLRDLNTLVDASGAGWVLQSAEAVNDAGQIAGWGRNPDGEQEAWLLTPITGACCTLAGCLTTTEDACACEAGVWLGAGSSCTPDPCSGQPGACCAFLPPLCFQGTGTDCLLLGGTYHGDGSICDDDTCEELPGACCLPIFGTVFFQCIELPALDCAAAGGTFAGAGTTCDPWPCPNDPTGACCLPDGTGGFECIVTTASDCGLGGGIYQGDATPCAADTCDCPYDLNGDGTVGFADLIQLLSVWGPCAGCPEDLDGDDVVGFTDLIILLSVWGTC